MKFYELYQRSKSEDYCKEYYAALADLERKACSYISIDTYTFFYMKNIIPDEEGDLIRFSLASSEGDVFDSFCYRYDGGECFFLSAEDNNHLESLNDIKDHVWFTEDGRSAVMLSGRPRLSLGL